MDTEADAGQHGAVSRIELCAGGVLVAALLFIAPASYAAAVFPATVETIDGESIDVGELARAKTLVVVTVKTSACPVCRRQLERIQARLSELDSCGATFLVLAPGPIEQVRALRDETGFPYPFVVDEELSIATDLGLRLGPEEIAPAILILSDDLSIGWAQRGRSARLYGDAALEEKVACWMSA